MKDKDFTVISNEVLRDENLSLKAKGFLVYLLSLSDDWDFSIHGIMKTTKEGEESIRTCIKQLIKHNYMKCEPVRINGRFAYNQYTIIEKPSMVKPYMEKPDVINTDTVKPDVENNDMYQNDVNNDIQTPLPIEPHPDKPDMANQAQRNTINNKINNNIDIVDEKILFSESIYFERFSQFETDMKKVFTKKNIDFNFYFKRICGGKKTNSEKYTDSEWKDFFINAIKYMVSKNENNFVLIEKEKIELHTFEKSKYFENYELFKSDFESSYPEIDSKYYFEKYSNQAISKGYTNADWKRTFQNWLNDSKGNYQKVIDTTKQQPITQNEKDISHYITLEEFMKFKKNNTGIAIFINNAKDAIPNIIHILPEITHWKTLEYFCEYEFGIDDLNYKEANARIKYSPTHKEFFDYSIIDQKYYEEMKRKRKYIPYSEFKKSIGINTAIE